MSLQPEQAIAQNQGLASQAGSPDIVITGTRLRGAVQSPLPPEFELDTGAVQAMGASSLAEILTLLAAQLGSPQQRPNEGPLLLVNGRRISSLSEVRDLPPEAIAKVEVLPEEAAPRFGFAAHQKLINVVLQPAYAALTFELEDRIATLTGRNDFNTELNAVRIAGNNRMTLDLQYQIGGRLLESDRGIDRSFGPVPASASGLVSGIGGGEISPSLSAIVGRGVALTPVPAQTSRPTLTDFAVAANSPALDDSGNDRTLLPKTAQFTANATFARALTRDMSLSLNVKLDRLASDALLGPAEAALTLPASNSFNPLGRDVRLGRYLGAESAIRRHSRIDSGHFATQLSHYGQWSLVGAINEDHASTTRITHGGVDASGYQQRLNINDPMANPFGPLSPTDLSPGPDKTNHSTADTLALDLTASGPLLALLAGSATLSLHTTLTGEWLRATSDAAAYRLSRTIGRFMAALDIPLLDSHRPIGALNIGFNAGRNDFGSLGAANDWNASLSWQPRKAVALLISTAHESAVPTMPQLGDPTLITDGAVLRDFGIGKDIAVTRIDGGNPALVRDRRRLLKAELTLKPAKGLNLVASYTDLRTERPLLIFPGISPAFAAALPQRIVRDNAGTVVSVDTRPFNAAREDRRELRWGLNFNRSFTSGGKAPTLPGGGGFGGGHSFGASGSMLQVALYHSLRLADDLVLRPADAPVDLIAGNSIGDALRTPRHKLDLQSSATHDAIGLRFSASWTSGGAVGTGLPGELHFSSQSLVSFRLFFFPGERQRLASAMPWLNGVRLLLVVDNLFDNRLHVTDRAGAVPLAYQAGYLDPIGRTIRFSIRKTF